MGNNKYVPEKVERVQADEPVQLCDKDIQIK